MKKAGFLIILSFVYQLSFSQYITPGTGVVWDLEDLVDNSAGIVTNNGGDFFINDNVIVSGSDTIRIISDEVIKVESGKLITVLGVFQAHPPQELLLTAIDSLQSYLGFRFEESDASFFKNCIIEFGGGIDLLYSDMLFEDCIIRKNDKSNSTGAIDLFHSSPDIINCEIVFNHGPAILSAATAESSPFISGNYIYHNNTTNQNMPQINLGTSNPELEIKIMDNHIEGDYTMVGGIAVTTLAGGSIECVIQGNTIIHNRYGITCYGFNISSLIDNNIIQDNNIQNIPMQGGSGINFWGDMSNSSIVSRNTISDNLWGITVTGDALPNLGQVEPDTVNLGKNFFYNNGNEGVIYDLYNNSPNDIFAENNHWGTYDIDTIEMNIFHQSDDPSLGFVDFLPIKDYITEIEKNVFCDYGNINIYPNPARDYFAVDFENDSELCEITVINTMGRKVISKALLNPNEVIDISVLEKGIYLVEIIQGKNSFRTKLIKQ